MGLINKNLFEPLANFISIHNFGKTIEIFDLNIFFEKVVTDQVWIIGFEFVWNLKFHTWMQYDDMMQ